MTRELSSHQKTSKVSDALREQYDSKSKDPTEPPMLIAAILDAGSTVRRHLRRAAADLCDSLTRKR